jgi:hypothetical protein
LGQLGWAELRIGLVAAELAGSGRRTELWIELAIEGYRRRIERSVGLPLAVQKLDRQGHPPR